MLTSQEVEEFVQKLLSEQEFLTGKVRNIADSKERKTALKQIEAFNKLITLLYDLKI